MLKLATLLIALMVIIPGVSAVSSVSGELTVNEGETAVAVVSLTESVCEGVIYEIHVPEGVTITHELIPENAYGLFIEPETGRYIISILATSEDPLGYDLSRLYITLPSAGDYIINLTGGEYSDGFLPYPIEDGQIIVHVILKGDLNGDGEVNYSDLNLVVQMICGIIPDDMDADFNDNGKIDIGDAVKLFQNITRGKPL